MARNYVGRIFMTGAMATVAVGFSAISAGATDIVCTPLAASGPLCSTDNSKNNTATIDSSPSQTGTATATGGAASGGGDGGAALGLNSQSQTTTNAIGQAIDSGNANHSFNGNGSGAHRVVVGGRSFSAGGSGGGSFVSLGVGGASNTGGAALQP